MNRIMKRILCIICAVLIAFGAAFAIYVGAYYHASESAAAIISQPHDSVQIMQNGNHIAFIPEAYEAGMIFYPGAKVQCEAYAPLMLQCAEQGILCVLVKMPCNLAILGMNAADNVQTQYPQVKSWYMAGHSLGGAMAASYIGKHTAEYDGLILLAAYAANDISASGLKVLSVYGSEDQVLKMEAYEKYRDNLPRSFTEVVLDGGCHACFGDYGAQKGDGTPTISLDEQLDQTVAAICALVKGSE